VAESTDERRLRLEKQHPQIDPNDPAEPTIDSIVDDHTLPGKLGQEPQPPQLPQLPHGLSRVDTLPEGFSSLLSRRPLFIGDVIAARYKLIESLGDGGMGQVFVAENLAIGRKVAVKVLKAELLADAHFRKRFQNEAQAIGAIEHRNVSRFLDLVVGDPTFLVMEYVPGPTLAESLKQKGRLDPARAIHLAIRICWGLDAVHRAGVVHRDLKPANIILAADEEVGEEPKIIDFGLAKLAYAPAEEQLTRSGQIIGTPHYMSPEQVENRDVDPRSDVYSLGCLLYHMVAGRPPFQGNDDLTVLYQHVRNQPDPLIKHAPDIPDGLEALVLRALAKNPDERFQNVKEMVGALTLLDRRRSGTGMIQQLRYTEPKRPIWPLVAAGLVLALAAGAAIGQRLARPAPGGALLVVGTEPMGATVELDGKALPETTPTAVRQVPPGPHRVKVSHVGFATQEQVVTLRSDGREIVDFALTPSTRTIEIQTVPAGALVYIDGHMQNGQTPLRAEISEGDFHGLRVEKPGFVPIKQPLKPEDRDDTVTLNLQAEKAPRGILWVDSNQATHVFVDGADTGMVAPTVGMIVGTGEHKVELRDSSGGVLVTSTVKVEQGDNLHLTLDGCAPVKLEGGR
jgi:tRNA A-37 threonylcarbamoyl transferase component Bud32